MVDPLHQRGVVLGRVLRDDAGVLDVVGHGERISWLGAGGGGRGAAPSVAARRGSRRAGRGRSAAGRRAIRRRSGPRERAERSPSSPCSAGTIRVTNRTDRGATLCPAAKYTGRTHPMPDVAPTTRAHAAAKRYIYAWGDGRAEGNGSMKDLLGGKGAGLAEMTNAGLPTPPGFTITTEACNDYFEAGKTAPGRPLGGRPRGGQGGRGEHRQGLRRSEEPAARLGPLRAPSSRCRA